MDFAILSLMYGRGRTNDIFELKSFLTICYVGDATLIEVSIDFFYKLYICMVYTRNSSFIESCTYRTYFL